MTELKYNSPGHWFEWAVLEMQRGVREDTRPNHDDPRIKQYGLLARSGGTWDDDQPWCAIFVNAALETSVMSKPGTGSAMAKSFLKYGKKIDKPRYGCIVVLNSNRGKMFGHVGFYVGETEFFVYVLGGNTDNSVKVGKFRKSLINQYRWPKKAIAFVEGPLNYLGEKNVALSIDS
jgi:uncharacterized protein (TIGR02594 family)